MPGTFAIFSAQYPPHMGGVETFTQSLARALVSAGDDVVVVTNDTNGVGVGSSVEEGVEVVRLPCVPLVDGRLPLSAGGARRRELLSALGTRQFDGVLVNARFYPHSLLGMRFAREHGLRPVALDHGSAWLSFSIPVLDQAVRLYERSITRRGRHRYDPAYYGISQRSVEWLRTFGIDAKGVITNSIDAREYRAASSGRDFRDELGLGRDKILVAFVGRLIPEKGVATLVQLAGSEELRSRGVTFVIAGDGPLADDVRTACGEGLRWVGRLGRPDVSALLQQADVHCLPTRSEGFSTALLEASACGCPSVVTDVGGARELIPDEGYGTIIDSMDPSAVEPALVRLADDRGLLARQSAACRALVEERFSWSVTAAAVERALVGAQG